MIIAGFGATVGTMYTFPTSMMEDDHAATRPPIVQTLPMTGGVRDVRGNARNPRAAQLIGKSFIVAQYTDPWVTLGTALDALRAATIAIGKTKLWALMRDGTYRWTWAKCVYFRAPEKVGQIHHCPVSLKFKVADSVWYSEAAHTGALVAWSNALTNAGNVATPVKVSLMAVTAACTAFEFRNSDGVNRVSFAGSVVAGKVFVIDSLKRSAKNDGTAAYAGMTIVGSGAWLSLPAGVSGITWQSSAGGAPTAAYEFYDAWVM